MVDTDRLNRLAKAFEPVVDRIFKGTDERIERAVAPLTERIEQLEHRVAQLEREPTESADLPPVIPDTALQGELDAADEGNNESSPHM